MLVRNAVRPRSLRSLASSSSPSSSWLLSSPSRPSTTPSSVPPSRGVSSTRPALADGPRPTNTISSDEIAHFSRLSAHWWDPTGEFGLLHRMNPARIEFLKGELLRVEELGGPRWLEGKDVLDVGCGGGIFAEVRVPWSSLSLEGFVLVCNRGSHFRPLNPVTRSIRRKHARDRCVRL